MSAAVALLIALAHQSASLSPHPDLRVQGRVSSVEEVQKAAEKCGLHKDHSSLSVVRGSMLFHLPDEPGAELTLSMADVSSPVRQCLRYSADHLRKQYGELRYTLDTF